MQKETDVLTIGITFVPLEGITILVPAGMIGIITFIISFAGVVIGNKFGNKYEKRAQFTVGYSGWFKNTYWAFRVKSRQISGFYS